MDLDGIRQNLTKLYVQIFTELDGSGCPYYFFSYVSIWDMVEDECEHCGILFTYAVQPSPTFSHCGNAYCAVMNGTRGQLAVAGYTLEEGCKYFESTNLTFAGETTG